MTRMTQNSKTPNAAATVTVGEKHIISMGFASTTVISSRAGGP